MGFAFHLYVKHGTHTIRFFFFKICLLISITNVFFLWNLIVSIHIHFVVKKYTMSRACILLKPKLKLKIGFKCQKKKKTDYLFLLYSNIKLKRCVLIKRLILHII